MMRRRTASSLGLTTGIIGKWVFSTVASLAPSEMGIGHAITVLRLLATTGIANQGKGHWEIIDAFASQAVRCTRKLELDIEKVSTKGSGIALGHLRSHGSKAGL